MRCLSVRTVVHGIVFPTLLFCHTDLFSQILINELDADTAGKDSLEFIELYDGGAGATALDSLVLVFFNGSTDSSYLAFDLDGFRTDSAGYFVLGNAGVQNVDLVFRPGKLQNGADAVALYSGDAADFRDAAVTLENLIDAVVYDTDDADDAGLLILLNPGQTQVNENAAGDKDRQSLQRIPNGSGGARNTNAFTTATPTPGTENGVAPPSQWTLDVTASPVDGGTVARDPDKTVYEDGETVDLTAEPAAGFSFDHWSGDLGGSDSTASAILVHMDRNRNLAAHFKEDTTAQWSLNTLVSPEGSGTVKREPDKALYGDGEAVTLTAGPGAGFIFSHWSGDLQSPDSTDAVIVLTMDRDRSVTAHFAARETPLRINELDADTPGSDQAEFIELYDGGRGSTSLDGVVLVLFNGSTDQSYAAFELTGFQTDTAGYFVLGNAAVENADLTFSDGTLQNGADAVALYFGSAADFPKGTAVRTTNLVDAIVYDTDDADDADLLALLNPGQPQVNENAAGDKDRHSLQRLPNGSGGARNTFTFAPSFPTPGAANEELPRVPDMTVQPPALDFGTVEVNAEFDLQLTVTNTGEADLQVDSTSVLGENAGSWFVTHGNAPFKLAVGATHEITICFNPKTAGKKQAVLRLRSNDPDTGRLDVPLSGLAVAANISASVTELKFGPVTEGTSRERSFVISNTGDADLQVSTVQLRGSNAAEFTLKDVPTAFALAQGSAKEIFAIFHPDSAGAKHAHIRFISNDPDNNPLNIVLSGTGIEKPAEPRLLVSPETLAFGDVPVGNQQDLQLTLHNSGSAPLLVDKLYLTGENADQWRLITNPAPLTLAPDFSAEVTVRFTPASVGAKQADLKISSDDPQHSIVSVPLSGNGSTPAFADSAIVINEIHYNPASRQGSDNDFEFIELFNRGDQAIPLNGYAFAEGIRYTFQANDILPAAGFLVVAKNSANYPQSIQWTSGNLSNSGETIRLVNPASETVDLVEYSPQPPWPAQANGKGPSLELKNPSLDNSRPENWQASSVAGGTPGAPNSPPDTTAPRLAVSPLAYDFGIVDRSARDSCEIKLHNFGTAVLTVFSVALGGPERDNFVVANQSFDVPPGDSTTLVVFTAPKRYGRCTAVVQLISNAADADTTEVPVGMYVNTPPPVPVLYSPLRGEIAERLTWSSVADSDRGDVVHYTLNIARDSLFTDLAGTIASWPDTSIAAGELAERLHLAATHYYFWRVSAADDHGARSPFSGVGYFFFPVGDVTGVARPTFDLPDDFQLAQNYPNPFNPQTTIRYELPERAGITLRIFDVRGRAVKTLIRNKSQEAGSHKVVWHGENDSGQAVSSGVYFTVLHINPANRRHGMRLIRKMTLLK